MQSSTKKVELNCYLNMTGIYWGIAKYLNITEQNFKSIKLKKKERN